MPNYDYVCETCGKEFEVFQSMNDPRLEDCLEEGCNGKMKRLIGTGAGVIFKGSGFYETDYRSESYKAGAKKESGGEGGSGGGDGGGSGGGETKGGSGDSKATGGDTGGSSGSSSGSSSSGSGASSGSGSGGSSGD
ncbi:MAG: FmdB family zinc ribbon protein [Verrucomicrobiota bacterium]